MARAPSQKLDQYIVRLPDGMRDRLKSAAEGHKRSMNAEIVDRLDRSFFEDTENKFLVQLASRPFDEALPKGLAARIQASAEKNGRDVREELVQALETMFPTSGETPEEVIAGYQDLAEEFLATVKENAAVSRREVEEYRVMLGTVRILRYIIKELQAMVEAESIPEDVRLLIRTLNPYSHDDDELPQVLEDLFRAMEERDRLAEEEKAASPDAARAERLRRLQAITGRNKPSPA